MPKNSRNWARVGERFLWLAVASQVVLAFAAFAANHYQSALTCLTFAALTILIAVEQRDRAFLADHDAVVRVYKNGRLKDQLPLNFAPGQFLAQIEVAIAKGCTCGETHDSETVVREPHKDEL
jgi:hypothetical protein